MARVVRDSNLESRTARARLKQRSEPYWRALEMGIHLGYRKRSGPGTWAARRLNAAKRYQEERLGQADDFADATGTDILNYSEAQAAARRWNERQKQIESGGEPVRTGPYKIKEAVADYIEDYKTRGRGLDTINGALKAHILPPLGEIDCTHLSADKIKKWRAGVASGPARLRTAKAATRQNFRPQATEPDAIRARRSTANNVLTILKAVLNYGYHNGRIASADAWRTVKPYKGVGAARIRYLSGDEIKRLTNACPSDFRQLVRAGLLTGCRYGELTRLVAADYNADSGTLLIRTSKSGKHRYVYLTDEAKDFFEAATAGKVGTDLILKRSNGKPWKESEQRRPLIAACETAKIAPAISFHILRHTHGSLLAMAGAPMAVIAQQLGHADTRITERHYAHLAPSYVADTIRAKMPNLGIVEKSKVEPLSTPKRGING